MKRLKKGVSISFVLYAFLLSAIERIIEAVFEEYILIHYESFFWIFMYLFLSFVAIFFVAWLFTKSISKKFNVEMVRQMEDKNILFTNIAHDLRTPITSILGFSKALKEKDLEEEQQLKIADTIYTKSKQTSELIDTMFEYLKLETQGYELKFQQEDICRITRDIVASQYEMLEEYVIDLTLEIPEEKILFSLDRLEYIRVLTNLLRNVCIHNSGDFIVLVKVEEVETKNRSYIQVAVADNGMRIPEELKDSIFEAFVSGDESRSSKGGSGLGLAISKSIMKRHKGDLVLIQPYFEYTKAFVMQFEI